MKRIILYLVTSLLCSLHAYAQLSVPDSSARVKLYKKERNKKFLENTLTYAPLSYASPPFFDIGSPKTAYILSADIRPVFAIGGKWNKFPIHLSPRYKVRIFRDNINYGDSSLPVRTPSYMPGGTIFIPIRKKATLEMPLIDAAIEYEPKILQYLSASFFHHSNGQDGNEFDQQGNFNYYNGNFSSNYVELAYHYRFRSKGDPCTKAEDSCKCLEAFAPYKDYYFRLGLEKALWTAQDLKSSYGPYRLNFSFSYLGIGSFCDKIGPKGQHKQYEPSYYGEKYRIVVDGTFIIGRRDRGLSNFDKRTNLTISYNRRIKGSPNTAWFLGAGYYGSDPYNIYYPQSYPFVHAGLSMGFFVRTP